MESLFPIQVVVKGTNGTIVVNTTLSPDANDMTLTVNSESLSYTIQIAVENEVGQGPFSNPLQVEFDPIIQIAATNGDIQESFNSQERTKQVWIIGVASAALFILILLSAIICYKKKLNSRQKPLGYLAASTTDDIHCQLSRHSNGNPIIKNDTTDKRGSKDTSLWIDRRWGSDS